ncbi:MAG: hypothetical protein AAGA25_06805 [Planctomycetota bacterium]
MPKQKTSIALPQHILETVDWVAEEVGVTRTDVITFALSTFLYEDSGDEDARFAFDAYDQKHDFRMQLMIRAKEIAERGIEERFSGGDE